MKKTFKNKTLLLAFLICAYGVLLQLLNYNEFNHKVLDGSGAVDSIKIHFIHGSIARKNCSDKRERMGGKLGGHIEIEVDSLVYGLKSLIRLMEFIGFTEKAGRNLIVNSPNWILIFGNHRQQMIKLPQLQYLLTQQTKIQ